MVKTIDNVSTIRNKTICFTQELRQKGKMYSSYLSSPI